MATAKILLTGASGYIGGAVLAKLLASNHSGVEISALVRSPAHADVVQNLGIKSILFTGLEDLQLIKSAASEHDIVISCASAMDLQSCNAFVEGLGLRKARTGSEVHYIHTSGASNFGDHPITGDEFLGIRCDKDDIFGWEKEGQEGWITRKVDVAITEAGLRLGVRTYIINPPLIYGTGEGPINKLSLQIPALIKMSLALKYPVLLGDGKGLWKIVHISDVANLYNILLQNIQQNQPLEFGKTGYYFAEAREVTWLSISRAIAAAGVTQGVFASNELVHLSPDDFAEKLGITWLNGYLAEVIWGSNSRIVGVRSRELGWKPNWDTGDFETAIMEDFKVICS